MARYLEVAEQLQSHVKAFVEMFIVGDDTGLDIIPKPDEKAVEDLGHIINLAVRCNPRQSQRVVRKNIVEVAMRNYCDVSMTKEYDEKTRREFNLIHISAKATV